MRKVDRLCSAIDHETARVRAVYAVTQAIERGETLALMGECGGGKSMTALSILRRCLHAVRGQQCLCGMQCAEVGTHDGLGTGRTATPYCRPASPGFTVEWRRACRCFPRET